MEIHETWTESYQGGESPRAELGMEVLGATSLTSAAAAMWAYAPSVFVGLVKVDYSLELAATSPQTRYSGKVTYGERKRPEVGEYEYEFRTGGGTQHVTVSKSTIASYGNGTLTPPSTYNIIGLTDDGADGVDIHVPCFEWSETWYIAHSLMSDAYIELICDLTAKVSSAAMKITPWSTSMATAGEILFLGSEGKARVKTVDWAISFHFARSKNAQNIVTGPVTVTSKKGWEHVWYHRVKVIYGTGADACPVQTPDYAKVEQVYDTADLNSLFPVGYR